MEVTLVSEIQKEEDCPWNVTFLCPDVRQSGCSLPSSWLLNLCLSFSLEWIQWNHPRFEKQQVDPAHIRRNTWSWLLHGCRRGCVRWREPLCPLSQHLKPDKCCSWTLRSNTQSTNLPTHIPFSREYGLLSSSFCLVFKFNRQIHGVLSKELKFSVGLVLFIILNKTSRWFG